MQILVFNQEEKKVILYAGPYIIQGDVIAVIKDVTTIDIDNGTYCLRDDTDEVKLQTPVNKTTIIYR